VYFFANGFWTIGAEMWRNRLKNGVSGIDSTHVAMTYKDQTNDQHEQCHPPQGLGFGFRENTGASGP